MNFSGRSRQLAAPGPVYYEAMDLRTRAAARLYAAMGTKEPLDRLSAAVRSLISEGHSHESLTDELETLRTTLLDEGREADEDVVLEVMDFLTGWCSPHQRV